MDVDSDATHGQWKIDINEDSSALIVEMSHLGTNGVETFVTAMPPGQAIEFAEAIIYYAQEIS